MKKQFRTAMLSTACMLIVAVMSLTGVTYAWFTQSSQADVTGMSMNVASAAGGIEITTLGNSTWATSLNVATIDESKAKLSGVMPVSTVDGVSFVALQNYNPANSAQGKFVATSANYIVQELVLRNTGAEDITVDFRNSYIQDSVSAKPIGKAGRIAIFLGTKTKTGEGPEAIETINYELIGVMAPYYNPALTTNWYAIDTQSYKGIDATKGAAATWVEFGNDSDPSLGDRPLVAPEAITVELPGMEGTTHTEVNIKVVVWLEGQDSDCTTLNAGGAFDIYLQLNKTTATVEDLDHATAQ